MRKLTYGGKTYLYDVITDESEWGSFTRTNFYPEGVKMKTVKTFWLFGDSYEIPAEKPVFTMYMDIESPYITKQQVRSALDKNLALIERAKEIKRGEFV